MSPEFCMVVEDEDGIVGYAIVALNATSFNQKLALSWIPEMQMKYPLENISDLPASVQVIYLINLFLFRSNIKRRQKRYTFTNVQ